MISIDVSPNIFVPNLLSASRDIGLCLLDSCGTEHADSDLLIAGLFPLRRFELTGGQTREKLAFVDSMLTGEYVAVFSLSYDFGRKLFEIGSSKKKCPDDEPDIFVSLFDALLVHDYSTGKTILAGNKERYSAIQNILGRESESGLPSRGLVSEIKSNFSKTEYIAAVDSIKEHIRKGDTYQTNLTQKLTVQLPSGLDISSIFESIRRDNPAPFAAVLEREDSTVISVSPERFFRVEGRKISASPIKGTRRRGTDEASDRQLRFDLSHNEKDRAENIMIVDLLRNDLGQVCEFGSVHVTELCRLQELPTVFHLVSDIEGTLRQDVRPSQMIKALFPCGSITGAPKLRTMQLIDELEPDRRGLSMGAIGVYIPDQGFSVPGRLDLSVAIRTMVVRGDTATFNVGGGVLIDSDPEGEYEESLIKARALLAALNAVSDLEKNV